MSLESGPFDSVEERVSALERRCGVLENLVMGNDCKGAWAWFIVLAAAAGLLLTFCSARGAEIGARLDWPGNQYVPVDAVVLTFAPILGAAIPVVASGMLLFLLILLAARSFNNKQ